MRGGWGTVGSFMTAEPPDKVPPGQGHFLMTTSPRLRINVSNSCRTDCTAARAGAKAAAATSQAASWGSACLWGRQVRKLRPEVVSRYFKSYYRMGASSMDLNLEPKPTLPPH